MNLIVLGTFRHDTPGTHLYVVISTVDRGKLLHALMDLTLSSLLSRFEAYLISLHVSLTAFSRMNDLQKRYVFFRPIFGKRFRRTLHTLSSTSPGSPPSLPQVLSPRLPTVFISESSEKGGGFVLAQCLVRTLNFLFPSIYIGPFFNRL